MTIPQITQIIRRTDQGATRPFICHTDDGHTYYAKGRSASTGERIREWMGTHLAKAFGLPVPPMRLLEAPDLLIRSSGNEALQDLGTGYAVGSRQIPAVSELRNDEIPLIPSELQQAILVFDYWVQNEDRTLTNFGGNPNLLRDKTSGKLYAIDYNLILPNHFDADLFWQTHVFRNSFDNARPDKVLFKQKMQRALLIWQQTWDQLPEEWLDENQAIAAFDAAAVLQQLEQDAAGAIWEKFDV